jgi:hypothetical protein
MSVALSLAQSNMYSIGWGMATKDQLLYSALHGTAWRHAAEQHNLADAVAELREMAGGRNDTLTVAAGVTAGAWHAAPSAHVGIELLVAGMLIMAGGYDGKPLDYGDLERWTRVGYERGMRSRKGER